MDRHLLTQAFNEWMRRYIEEPERFKREWESVLEYTDDIANEETPCYGRICAQYLEQLCEEVSNGA